jgi:hypothetical protein
MASNNQENPGTIPEFRNSKIKIDYLPGYNSDANEQERLEEAKQELLARVKDLALKIENLLQITASQEIHWVILFSPPMSKGEEMMRIERVGFEIYEASGGNVEMNLARLHLNLPEDEIKELKELERRYLENWDEKLREELNLKFSEKVVNFRELNFRRFCLKAKVSVVVKDGQDKNREVSYFDNILIRQNDTSIRYKGGVNSESTDDAAQYIVECLTGVRPGYYKQPE